MTPLSVRLAGAGICLLAVLFGGYLLYDRVLLSLQAGAIEERVGLVARESDPVSFWMSVGLYGAIGAVLVLIGGIYLVRSVRKD